MDKFTKKMNFKFSEKIQVLYLTTLFSIETCTFQNNTNIRTSNSSFHEVLTCINGFYHCFMVLIKGKRNKIRAHLENFKMEHVHKYSKEQQKGQRQPMQNQRKGDRVNIRIYNLLGYWKQRNPGTAKSINKEQWHIKSINVHTAI